MSGSPRLAVLVALAATIVALAAPTVRATSPTAPPVQFGQPSATAVLGQPITVTSTVFADDIASVEVLIRLKGEPASVVLPAQPALPGGTWQATAEIDIATSALCACLADGQSAPNTAFEYQFRVRGVDGTTTLGPVGAGIVSDDRFEWRILEEDQVRVHWYVGDETFARSALDVANGAIDRASELLGVTLAEPVDLFVYDTEDALRSAVSPNRENVVGQAHAAIQTMFVHIPGDESASSFAGTLVAHELTHLVFDAATDNPYHGVPRWLDEGVAAYLSEGYSGYWKSFVDGAVADRSLIPLDGLAGLFPSPTDQFFLAYGEAVAAVDFFVKTHTEQTLWELVGSYASGLSDDEAFSAATGADLNAFNAAWFASLGADVPAPLGPQPGPPGPVPSGWTGEAPPTLDPSVSPGPGEPTATPRATAALAPGVTVTESSETMPRGAVVVVWLVLVGGLLALLVLLIMRRNRARRPPFG